MNGDDPAEPPRDLFGEGVLRPERGRQLPLPLAWGQGGEDSPAPFLTGESNRHAARHVLGWREWAAPATLLVGPPLSGRSTLAALFAGSGGGEVIDPLARAEEEAVFHAWNRAAEGPGRLLVVADSPASIAAIRLPDLRTRLASAPVATIGPPDACLSRDLIAHLLGQRGLNSAPQLDAYVAERIERSYRAIHAAVDAIDAAALATGGGATIPVARAALIAAGLYDASATVGDSPSRSKA